MEQREDGSRDSTQCGVNSRQRGCTHGDDGLLGLQHVGDDAVGDDEEDVVL